MDLATLELIVHDLRSGLLGRRFGKIFVPSRFEIAVDARLPDSRYLFVSVEPGNPRLFFIRRRLRDLEKGSINPTPFHLRLRKELSGLEFTGVEMIPGERVIDLSLEGQDDLGERRHLHLVSQLTGRSANLFLLGPGGVIVDALRETDGEGQEPGTTYRPPERPLVSTLRKAAAAPSLEGFADISEALDAADLERRAENEFRSLASSARAKVRGELVKVEKLRKALTGDLAGHGDAEKWKRLGDLLLANVSTARRIGGKFAIVDYYDEAAPTIEIDADENDSVTETAEKFFRRYTKARNARDEISRRLEDIDAKLEKLRQRSETIESAIELRDLDALSEFAGAIDIGRSVGEKKQKFSAVASVARVFDSSDGLEILVGKRAKDNDQLTFKIARSLDTWMHAADYPGSHVVIRNPDRKEVPQQTLLEAAQLAAFYSQGKAQTKAAVHYTQKKFVNKPKGAAPGLVSLASFKTLLVEPGVPDGVTRRQP